MSEGIIRCLEEQNNSDSQIIFFRGCMELLPIAVLPSASSNSLWIFNTFKNRGSNDQNMIVGEIKDEEHLLWNTIKHMAN